MKRIKKEKGINKKQRKICENADRKWGKIEEKGKVE